MSLKKTLFLSEFYPPQIGGTCTMFAGRFGCYPPDKVIVVTKMVDGAETFDQSARYPIVRVPLLRNGPPHYEWAGMVWDFIKTGWKLIRQHQIERIECARPFPEGIAAYVLSKRFGIPYLNNVHGDEVGVFQRYRVERVLIKKTLRAARLNLASSHATERLVKQLAGADLKTQVVLPGFSPAFLGKPAPEAVARLREQVGGSPILLTVGRIAQVRKGHDHVIKALPDVIPHFPNVKYVVIGATDDLAIERLRQLRAMADELGVNDHIFWVEDVINATLPVYYAACDLFLMPNRVGPPGDVEGFGIVYLEAGYFNKPVIGGNSGGVPDAVLDGNTGLLVDGTDPHDVARGILQILSNPALAAQMGEHGAAHALSLTHERVFERYQQIITEAGA